MNEFILAIIGFVAALIGAAFVGSKLNESKHKSETINDQGKNLVDLTTLLAKHDRINADEIAAIKEIPNVKFDDIDRILHQWPEVSGVFTDADKASNRKLKSKKMSS